MLRLSEPEILMRKTSTFVTIAFAALLATLQTSAVEPVAPKSAPTAPMIRSAKSGLWSSPDTWEGAKIPAAGDNVLIRTGQIVTYDVDSSAPLWAVHVAGTLTFDPQKNTQMDVGLLIVQSGEEDLAAEDVVQNSEHHHGDARAGSLLIGTADHPIDAAHHALIRLTYQQGMDPDAYPALIDCGGRMELHGAKMDNTWVKLKNPATAGQQDITVDQTVTGWKVGDRIILVSTEKLSMFDHGQVIESVKPLSHTEQRFITSINGQQLKLDKPLGYDHRAEGDFRGEVANLSRNVIVESADPNGVRGHTMYHRDSTGSVSYAEFRHLGKTATLGRYSLHFHLAGDTMRGSSVIGASIWDSGNHWITIHGTNYLVIRDCVGYQASGHGFFLEDGTEEYNVFDHNLAVQALHAQALPHQVLAFDHNDGAGFWWANCLNTFINNDAAECDQYGYRFEAGKSPQFNSTLSVRQPDGTRSPKDIRTIPFIRFENNEAHSQRRFALDLGGIRMVAGNDAYITDASGKRGISRDTTAIGDVGGVGPDYHHPFVIKNFRVWASQWSYHSACPNVLVDGLTVYDSNYGIWRTRVDGVQFKNLDFHKIAEHDIFVPWGGAPDYDNEYNKSLKPVDDLPPSTVITRVERTVIGDLAIYGTTADNGIVTQVKVNGELARSTAPNFSQWESRLSSGNNDPTTITARATDAAGNIEKTPHVLNWKTTDPVTALAK
jgi:hypothetical protein